MTRAALVALLLVVLLAIGLVSFVISSDDRPPGAS